MDYTLNGRNILVTGGAGFLGSHLCERLLSEGAEVLCLDDYSTGSQANISHLFASPRFRAIQHDVAVPLKHTGSPFSAIFNLACPASPAHYQRDPVATIRTSVLGALNMLDLAARMGCRILQASTSEVYGDPHVHPQAENYWGNVNPIGPRACYDEGKRCAETLFFDYRRKAQGALDIKVMRIFNTYGPRMDRADGRVVSNFIVQALQNHAISIYGDGSQTRSFCYVDDLIEGMVRLMRSPAHVTGPINIGNPVESTILDLAALVIRLTGSRSRLAFHSLPADDPKQRGADITLARELLGWTPKVMLEEGLRRTIRSFQHRLAAA